MIEKVQQPRVGIVGVLDEQNCWGLGRQPLEEQPPPGE
jgi:hypothetical protein